MAKKFMNKANQVKKTDRSNNNTKWLKNAVKSIGSVTKDAMKDIYPNLYEVTNTTANISRSMVTGFRQNKNNLNRVTDALSGNKYVKALDKAFKNGLEDIKSGNFNNQERLTNAFMSDMGGDEGFDDFFSGNDSFDSSPYSFGDEDVDAGGDNYTYVDASGYDNNEAMLSTLSDQMARNTKAQMETNKASMDAVIAAHSASMFQVESIGREVIDHLSNISNSLTAMVEYNNENMTKFIDSSIAFYERMGLSLDNEDEYSYDSDSDEKISITDVYNGTKGGINFSEYKNYIKKSIMKTAGGSAIEMVTGMLDDEMLDMMASNPVGFASKAIVGSVVPKIVGNTLKSVEDVFSAFVPTMLGKLTKIENGVDNSFSGKFKTFLAQTFGVKSTRDTEIHGEAKLSNSAIPFDKQTKHAVTEIITKELREQSSYLREIAKKMRIDTDEAVSNSSVFSYQTGRYVKQSDIQGRILEELKDSILNAFKDNKSNSNSHLNRESFGSQLYQMIDYVPKERDRNILEKGIDQLLINLARSDSNYFDPADANDESWKEVVDKVGTNRKAKKQILEYILEMKEKSPETYFDLTRSVHAAREAYNNKLQEISEDPTEYNLWASGLNGRDDIDDLIDKQFKYGQYDDHRAKLSRRFERAHIERDPEEYGSFGRIITGTTDGAKNFMLSLMRGDRAGLQQSMVDTVGSVSSTIIGSINNTIVRPLRDGIFGTNEDGGILSSIKAKFSDLSNGIRYAISGKEYTDSDGETHPQNENSLVANFKFIGNGIKERIFGKEEIDEDGNIKRSEGMLSFITSRFKEGWNSWMDSVFGEAETDEAKEERKKRIINELKDRAPDTLTGGVIGAGVGIAAGSSLLGTIMLGPIGGAAMGSAIGFARKSDKFQTMLFGEKDEDGDRIGGLISKKTQDFFKEHKGFLTGSAAIGAASTTLGLKSAGVLGNLVGGPIAGAIMGLGTGIILKSKAFHKFLFGDEASGQKGLKNALADAWNKHAKKNNTSLTDSGRTVGTALAGAGAGITGSLILQHGLLGASLGPAGIVGGALAGLAITIKAQGHSIKEFFFGKDYYDENGDKQHHKGVLGQIGNEIKANLINPLTTHVKFISDNIMNDIEHNFLMPIAFVAEDLTSGISNFIHKTVGGLATGVSNVGKAIYDVSIGKVVGKIATISEKIMEKTSNALYTAVSLPGQLLRKGVEIVHNKIAEVTKPARDFLKVVRKRIFSGIGTLFKTVTKAAVTPFKLLGGAIMTGIKGIFGGIGRVIGNTRLGRAAKTLKKEFNVGGIIGDIGDRVRLNREEYLDRKKKIKAQRTIDKAHDKNAKLIKKVTRGQYAEDTEEARAYARTLDSNFDAKLAKMGTKTIDAADTEKRKLNEKIKGRSTHGMGEERLRTADLSRLNPEGQQASLLAKIWYVISGKARKDRKEKERRRAEGRPLDDNIKYNDKGVPMIKYGDNFYTKSQLKQEIGDEEADREWAKYKGKFVNQDPNIIRNEPDNNDDDEEEKVNNNSISAQFKATVNEYRYMKAKKKYQRKLRNGNIELDEDGNPISFEEWGQKHHKRFMHGEGYAEGTGSATPGIHPINEKGTSEIIISSGRPELRSFKGGETVLPTDRPLAVYITDVSKETEDKLGPEEETESEKAKRIEKERDDEARATLSAKNEERRKKAIDQGLTREEKKEFDKRNIKDVVKKAVSGVGEKVKEVKDSLGNKISGFVSKFSPLLKIGGVALLANFLGLDWSSIGQGIKDGASALADNMPKIMSFGKEVGSVLVDNVPKILGFGKKVFSSVKTVVSKLGEVVSTIGGIASKLGVGIKNTVDSLIAGGKKSKEQREFADENKSTSLDTGTAKENILDKSVRGVARAAINPTVLKKESKLLGKASLKGAVAGVKGSVKTAKLGLKVANGAFKLTRTGRLVNAVGRGIANSKVGKGAKFAANVVKDYASVNASKKLESVSKIVKGKSDDLLKKVTENINKFFTTIIDKLKSSKIGGKIASKLSTRTFKHGPKPIIKFITTHWTSLATKISAKLGIKGGAAAVTAGLAEVAFITAGAINGVSGTAKLFQVDKSEVDTTMKVISGVLGGFSGSTIGTIFDIINEVYYAIEGVDLYNSIACSLYRFFAGEEKYDKLDRNQASFKQTYIEKKDDTLKKQYETQKKAGIIDEKTSFKDFKKGVNSGKYKAKYDSFEDYNKDVNASFSDKMGKHFKRTGKAITDTASNVKAFFAGKKETYYTDDKGNKYTKNDDGSYQIKDKSGKDLGFVSKDALPKNLKEYNEEIEGNILDKAGSALTKVSDSWSSFWGKITGDEKEEETENKYSVLNKKTTDKNVVYYVKLDNYMTYYKKDDGKDTYSKYNLDGSVIEENVPKFHIDELLRANLLKSGRLDNTDDNNKKTIDNIKKSFNGLLGNIDKNVNNTFRDLNSTVSNSNTPTYTTPTTVTNTNATSNKESLWDKIKNFFGGKGEGKSKNGGHGPSKVNGFSYYSQNDSSWSNSKYGNDGATMGDSGCGPTAMSMVASELTGQNITPTDSARLAEMTGDRDETGTNWDFINKASGAYGLSSREELDPSAEDIARNLSQGNPMILSGRTGGYGNSAFTKAGHYVVATGIDKDGNVEINDPRGPEYSGKKDLFSVANETGAGWSFGGYGKKDKSETTEKLGSINPKNDKKTKVTNKNNKVKVNTKASSKKNKKNKKQKAENGDRSNWISVVKAVKAAIAAKGCGYSHPSHPFTTKITVNGKTVTMRPDCSGFTTTCLCFYGVMDFSKIMSFTSTSYTSRSTSDLIKTGFKPRAWKSWDDLVQGDIIALNGHVEIFDRNENGIHYVWNCGSDKSTNNPNSTGTGHTGGYTTVWSPDGVAGKSASFSSSNNDATISTSSATTTESNSQPNLFSAITSIMGSAVNKAINGMATGEFDTDFTNDIDIALGKGSSQSSTATDDSASTDDGPLIMPTGTGSFPKYPLTEKQAKGIANIVGHEQGGKAGRYAEASLMVNLLDKNGGAKNTNDLIASIDKPGSWFAYSQDRYRNPDGPDSRVDKVSLQAVKDVIIEGKRTLPRYVDEHDCIKDLRYSSSGDPTNRKSFKPHDTTLRNRYKSVYTFYDFPGGESTGVDPFGYTNKDLRKKWGDDCYSVDGSSIQDNKKSKKKLNKKVKVNPRDNKKKKKGGKGEGTPTLTKIDNISGYNPDYETAYDIVNGREDTRPTVLYTNTMRNTTSTANKDYNKFVENIRNSGNTNTPSDLNEYKILKEILKVLKSIDKSSDSSNKKLDALNELKKISKNSIENSKSKNKKIDTKEEVKKEVKKYMDISNNIAENTKIEKLSNYKPKNRVEEAISSVHGYKTSKNEMLAREIAKGGN